MTPLPGVLVAVEEVDVFVELVTFGVVDKVVEAFVLEIVDKVVEDLTLEEETMMLEVVLRTVDDAVVTALELLVVVAASGVHCE